MRSALLALLCLVPLAHAEEAAAWLPNEAIAYVEIDGLAKRSQEFFASDFFQAVRDHAVTKAFLASPEGQKLVFGHGMMQGMIGLDAPGLLRELGRGTIPHRRL